MSRACTARAGRVRNEQGVLHLPMAAAAVPLALAGMLLFGLMGRIRRNAETQLRLDRCVASEAIRLQGLANRIELDNAAISTIRRTMAAAALNPASLSAAQAALAAVVARQELALAEWS